MNREPRADNQNHAPMERECPTHYAVGVPTVVDQAVVIRHWDFSETSQTVSLFTRDHGVVRALAKGSRRERAPFSGGLELLTRGEMVAILKPSNELALLTEWDLQEVFWAARRSLAAHRAGMYLIDLVHHAIVDHDPHPAVFAALVDALHGMEKTARIAGLVLAFQWALIVEMGYRPRLEMPAHPARGRAVRFSSLEGGVIGTEGENGASAGAAGARGPVWRVRAETIELLRAVESGAGVGGALGPAVQRAGRLLSEHLRVILDRDLPTRAALFGPPARGS